MPRARTSKNNEQTSVWHHWINFLIRPCTTTNAKKNTLGIPSAHFAIYTLNGELQFRHLRQLYANRKRVLRGRFLFPFSSRSRFTCTHFGLMRRRKPRSQSKMQDMHGVILCFALWSRAVMSSGAVAAPAEIQRESSEKTMRRERASPPLYQENFNARLLQINCRELEMNGSQQQQQQQQQTRKGKTKRDSDSCLFLYATRIILHLNPEST